MPRGPPSEETRRKISDALRGRPKPWKAQGGETPPSERAARSKAKRNFWAERTYDIRRARCLMQPEVSVWTVSCPLCGLQRNVSPSAGGMPFKGLKWGPYVERVLQAKKGGGRFAIPEPLIQEAIDRFGGGPPKRKTLGMGFFTADAFDLERFRVTYPNEYAELKDAVLGLAEAFKT